MLSTLLAVQQNCKKLNKSMLENLKQNKECWQKTYKQNQKTAIHSSLKEFIVTYKRSQKPDDILFLLLMYFFVVARSG